jgi:hypothetical protein
MRRVLATAQKLDLKYIVGGALQGLTNILAYLGSLDEARATGLQAISVTIAQNDRRFQGYAEAYLSVTEYLAGDYLRAERLREHRRDDVGERAFKCGPSPSPCWPGPSWRKVAGSKLCCSARDAYDHSNASAAWMTATQRYDWRWPSA